MKTEMLYTGNCEKQNGQLDTKRLPGPFLAHSAYRASVLFFIMCEVIL